MNFTVFGGFPVKNNQIVSGIYPSHAMLLSVQYPEYAICILLGTGFAGGRNGMPACIFCCFLVLFFCHLERVTNPHSLLTYFGISVPFSILSSYSNESHIR